MRAPIFVAMPGEVAVFRDAAHVTSYCEPIDVESGEYGSAYDADGRALRFEVDARNAVAVRQLEEQPAHTDELRCMLIDFFVELGEARTRVETLPLAGLVDEARRYELP